MCSMFEPLLWFSTWKVLNQCKLAVGNSSAPSRSETLYNLSLLLDQTNFGGLDVESASLDVETM